MSNEVNRSERTGLEIAVIGMAGRFPGAADIHEFWRNIKEGVESVAFFSDEELEKAGINPALIRNNRYVKAKGILNQVEYFDALFFDYSPAEARIMDPQMRILFECVWESLEDAGYDPESYKGSIGLYAGSSASIFWNLQAASITMDSSQLYGATLLNDRDFLCTQISYKLNLKGPAVTVQTACSTSLVAIHMACQSLLSGECHIALAGGVSVPLPRKTGYLHQEGMISSSDGHCWVFDRKADGTLVGEGAGVVALRLLAGALRDGDHIYAVVKGSAVNNDGKRKVGYAAPSVKGQAGVIRAAYRAAGISPETIGYIEAHGTGTSLGDPVEIESLKLAFNTDKRGFCRIGAVKANIGHLNSAAGVAGFIKAALVLKYRLIPPAVNFMSPNPEIDFVNSPFYVNTCRSSWERDGHPLRAGVSSFGIGGTNAHAILEEAPEIPAIPSAAEERSRRYRLILLSAKTPAALKKQTRNLAEFLKENRNINLGDAAFTLQAGRRAFKHRQMLVCKGFGVSEVIEPLSGLNSDDVRTGVIKGKDIRLVFMFPGQGAQYIDMGLDLYRHEPLFRQEIEHCFEILEPTIDYDLKKILYPGVFSGQSEDRGRGSTGIPPWGIDQTEVAQSVIFIFEYALSKLLMKWGLEPFAMIGHSIGEYTAACLSGVLTLEDALRLVALRGSLMQKVPEGAMLSVPLAAEELRPLLDDELSVAAVNSPARCVISGPCEAIEAFSSVLRERGHESRKLHTSHAFHSHMMEPILEEFQESVGRLDLGKPRIPYISNLSGTWVTDQQAADPAYWARHLRETVRFSDGTVELLKEEKIILVEVGPGNMLSTLVRQHNGKNVAAPVVNLVRHPKQDISDDRYLLREIGQLWISGKAPDWKAFHDGEKRRRVPLPAYPFERKRFWIDRDIFSLKLGNLWGITGSPIASKEAEPERAEIPETPGTEVDNDKKGQRPELSTLYVAPRDEVQEILVKIWQEFFGFSNIGIHDDFFELGGDSLKATTILAEIQKRLNLKISLSKIFEGPTVAKLAELFKDESKSVYEDMTPMEKREYYPQSATQKRLFFLSQFENIDISYNLPFVLGVQGKLDMERFFEAIDGLIKRHEALRTSFELVEGEPVQRIHESVDFEIESIRIAAQDMSEKQIEKQIQEFIQPFGLSSVPLLRIGILTLKNDEYLLLFDIHHIISDGTSIEILEDELIKLYTGTTLSSLRIQYKDFSCWQNSFFGTMNFKKQEEFWLDLYSDIHEHPRLNLPTDYRRPSVFNFSGGNYKFYLCQESKTSLKEQLARTNTTMFMGLLAIFYILLYKYSGQDDIIIGCGIAGRQYFDVQNTIGMFVNSLPIRNHIDSKLIFPEFLESVKRTSIKAFENQDVQFENLVGELNPERDPSRNPIFDVSLVVQNFERSKTKLEDIRFSSHEYVNRTSKFDISLFAYEKKETILFNLEYCTSLFRRDTIERFAQHFMNIIELVSRSPNIKISELDILSEPEKRSLLIDFNRTDTEYPGDRTITELYENQAEKTPDHVVLKYGENSTSYRQLDSDANQWANYLYHEKKPGLDSGIVIFLDANPMLLTGVLGILKSGGFYVPIDTSLPAERISYMINDIDVEVMLTQKKFIRILDKVRRKCDILHTILFMDRDRIDSYQEREAHESEATDKKIHEYPKEVGEYRLFPNVQSTNLVYCIYTSGTTGVPRGVLIEHKSLVNYTFWKMTHHHYTSGDVTLQLLSPAFDGFGANLYPGILSGGKILFVPKEKQLDHIYLKKILNTGGITRFSVIPSMYRLLLENIEREVLRAVKYVVLAGEKADKNLLELSRDLSPGITLINEYGPTENTITTTSYWGMTLETVTLIGKPISNNKIFILDANKKPIPLGVWGELYVSGDSMARGYTNRVESTIEKFVDNPFFPGKKMYGTGDLARWQADGNIEFLGRIDRQIKIRGFRIEPGEVEKRILLDGSVKDAAVMTRTSNQSDLYLCAYIVFRSPDQSITKLKKYLAQYLPEFMIPVAFIALDKMPLTPNGKVNYNALPLPQLLDRGKQHIGPRNEIEQDIVHVWEEILKTEKIDIYSDFFELGGNSINAITVTAQLSRNLNITINHIFQHRTVAAIADHVSRKKNYLKSKLEAFKNQIDNPGKRDFAKKAHQLIKKQHVEYIDAIGKENFTSITEKQEYQNILVTGGTGYFGSHLISDLLKTSTARLYLLVRGGSSMEAEERIREKLSYYFKDTFFEKNKKRLVVVQVNPSRDKPGSYSIPHELSETVDAVLHSAANVSHFGKYEDIRKDNVSLTEELLEFAYTGRKKDFHFISTTSVGQGNIKNKTGQLFTEYRHIDGQVSSNVYIRTKLEAEDKVINARQRGINATIYRLGNLVWNSETGKFQQNIEANAFFARMRALIALGMVPIHEESEFDITFIDLAARATALLLKSKSITNSTYHLYNPHLFTWEGLVPYFNFVGLNIKPVSMNLFCDYLLDCLETNKHQREVERLLLHSGTLGVNSEQTTHTHISQERTEIILEKLGFKWPPIDEAIIKQMISTAIRLNFDDINSALP